MAFSRLLNCAHRARNSLQLPRCSRAGAKRRPCSRKPSRKAGCGEPVSGGGDDDGGGRRKEKKDEGGPRGWVSLRVDFSPPRPGQSRDDTVAKGAARIAMRGLKGWGKIGKPKKGNCGERQAEPCSPEKMFFPCLLEHLLLLPARGMQRQHPKLASADPTMLQRRQGEEKRPVATPDTTARAKLFSSSK